jgi:hypothetical protein
MARCIQVKTHLSSAFKDYLRWIENGGSFSSEVLEVLHHSMRKDANNVKQDGTGRLRPSLIGDPCDRKQILSFRQYGGSSFNGNWMTWVGTFLHLAFQTYLLDTYPDSIRIEHKVAPHKGHLGVEGKADWYWYGHSENGMMADIHGPHIGDYKSMGKFSGKDFDVEKAPKQMHVDQLLYEMVTMKVNRGYLVYQTRGFGQMAVWELESEPADVERVEERLARLTKHTEDGTLPGILLPCLSWQGPYKTCNFAEVCMAHA